MKLNPNELLVLDAWAQGRGGASPRLARRAWWILQDRSSKRSAVTGGGAWANAIEAHQWVLNYHAMGLVGLVDSPRKGRPLLHGEVVQDIQNRLSEIKKSRLADSGEVKSAQLNALTRQEQEALWRQSRTKGQTVVRERYGKNLKLNVPYELRDVLAVVLTDNIKILAFFNKSDNYWSGLEGAWIGVPAVKRKGLIDFENNQKNLLTALALDIKDKKSAYKTDARTKWIVTKALEQIEEVAGQHPQKVSLSLIVDLDESALFIALLQKLRSKNLWVYQNPKMPGLLKQLKIYPFRKKWGIAIQETLVTHLSDAGANTLATFQDLLTLKRQGTFCWVRESDDHE